MAEVVISSVVELLLSTVKQLIQNEIKLVRGVDKELLDLSDKLNKVRNKLDDADMKQFKEKTVKDWLRRLELKSQEMEDVLEEWSYAIIQHTKMESGSGSSSKDKVCSFIPSSCFSFKKLVFRHDLAKKVENLKLELDEILNEKGVDDFVASQPRTDHSRASWRVQSTSLIDSEEIKGRKYDMDSLVKKLTAHEGLNYQILSIVGVGGLGKTTLAQLVYNDNWVEQCFDSRIWICVSDPFDVEVIAKRMIKAMNGEIPEDTTPTQLDDLLQALIGCVLGKKFLLVLDDVWNEERDKWECLRVALKRGGAGSKILVTTRKEHVARIMGSADEDIHRLDLLSNADCLSLLMRTSGRSEDEFDKFHKIGKEIAKKCNGLPLAAKTLGSALLLKKTVQEWEKLLESDIWDFEHMEVELFPHLLLSYNELSPTHKRCFSFCAFFPKDEVLEVEELIRIWMALGYLGSKVGGPGDDLEFKGREVFNDLAMRSLFQNFKEDESTKQIISCKMHDILHDFAQFLRKNGRVKDLGMTKGTCQVCDRYLVSNFHEYRSLVWNKRYPLNICDCLTSLRVLQYEVGRSPMKMEKLIHLKWLNITYTTLSKEDLETICKFYFLQTLFFRNCSIKEVPEEIGNLVHLRYLDLRENRELKELPESICRLVGLQTLLLSKCSLETIPREIGNLVHLRILDLSDNLELKELPKSICRLVELQTISLSKCSLKKLPREIGNLVHLKHLDLSWNSELKELPESVGSLVKLQILNVGGCKSLHGLPKELAQLSDLDSLQGFLGGSGCNKFELLRNLNILGKLSILINMGGSNSTDMKELVEDTREAELRNKIHLTEVTFQFTRKRDKDDCSSSLWVDVIEALELNHNLKRLKILSYKSSRLPLWISSPFNLVREIELTGLSELSMLPAMGKLPFLESLDICRMKQLKVLGLEWLGIRGREGEMMDISSSSSLSLVAFPKLKSLAFGRCYKWVEWEDITAEQEESADVSVMPCLGELIIFYCDGLKMLPQRLLRKASSLRDLYFCGSPKLKECYGDKDGSPWRSISQNNPQLHLHDLRT